MRAVNGLVLALVVTGASIGAFGGFWLCFVIRLVLALMKESK